MTIGKTGYGWTASTDPADFGGLGTLLVGELKSKFRVRKSLAKDGSDTILLDFWRFLLWELNRIEPCSEGFVPDEWSWDPKHNSNNASAWSEHCGGGAIDWNATQHPNNTPTNTGWTAAQVTKVHALITRMRNLVSWGNSYHGHLGTGPADPMHFEWADGTADTEGHARIKALVLEVVRPAFKADPLRYGLPLPAPVPVNPVVVKPATPVVVKPADVVPVVPVVLPPALWKAYAKVVATLDAPGAGNWQGGYQNGLTGLWYIVEGHVVTLADGSTREDAIYYEFSPTFVYLGKMTVEGGGHQTSCGISDDGTWWCSVGGKIVTIRQRTGQTVPASIGTVMTVPVDGSTLQISLTPTRTRAVIRRVQTTTETYSLWPKDGATFGARVGLPVQVARSSDRPVQGFSASGNELRVLVGHSNAQLFVERYDFTTGKPLPGRRARLDVTSWGLEPTEVMPAPLAVLLPGQTFVKVEGESQVGGRTGVKVGQGDLRELRVLDVDYAAVDAAIAAGTL